MTGVSSGDRAQTAESRPAIAVRGLEKTFGQGAGLTRALAGIDFDVPTGSFVSVVGPSGCGKSTLLSIIAGLTPASGGSVSIDGRAVSGPLPGQVAVIFQEALLLPWKTALANIEFPLAIQGVDKREREARSRAMLDLVGLGKFADHHPHQLSGGMRQRVSIARGLAQDPSIVLMDEPFGALDEQTRIRMGGELLQIWERSQKTVLFITHSLTEALFLSDTVLVMGRNPGRILETIDIPLGRPRDIDVIGTEAFGALRNRLWHLLNTDVALESGLTASDKAPAL